MQHANHLVWVLFLVLCTAAAAVIGSRHAGADLRRAPRGAIAYALEDTRGLNIYVVAADDVRVKRSFALPEHARLVVAGQRFNGARPQHIWNIAWSSNGRRLLYLVTRRTGDEVDAPWVVDLWGVDIDGSDQRLLQAQFMDRESPDFALPLEALLLCNPEGRHCERNNHPPRLDGSYSPDGRRVAYREAGIDSTWICVTDAGASREHALEDGECFGDGFFSVPAWSPF